jgi:hypothetical protein
VPAGVRPRRCGPHSGLRRPSCSFLGRRGVPVCWVVAAGRRAILRSVLEVAVVPAEGGFSVVSGGRSAALVAVPRARTGISGVMVQVSCVGGKVPEAFAGAVFLGAGRRHLTGEFRDFLLNCSCVEGWSDAGQCRLGCDLGDAVRTAGCGVQAAVFLAGEVGLYVGW